jgi:hypothetical protein
MSATDVCQPGDTLTSACGIPKQAVAGKNCVGTLCLKRCSIYIEQFEPLDGPTEACLFTARSVLSRQFIQQLCNADAPALGSVARTD